LDAYTSYLDRLGSNFLVAAMIPSLGLVIACLVVFDPILHASITLHPDTGMPSLIGIGLLLAVPTILIGFTLTAMNTFLLKLFEGYVFFHRFSFMKKAETRKAKHLLAQREILKLRIGELKEKKDLTYRDEKKLDRLREEYRKIGIKYDQAYPPPDIELMPTRFGNILKASEAYSGYRYGIDAVTFWPHLMHVVPPTYRKGIDAARNELSFLVNMSTLSVVFYFFCILAILSNAPVTGTSPDWSIVIDNSIRYILSGSLALILIIFFNRAAIFSVSDYGRMVRSAFDLFRLDLLEQFRLEPPKDSAREFELWKNLGKLISLGQEVIDFNPLVYHHPKKE
jgi:hypothetical protein